MPLSSNNPYRCWYGNKMITGTYVYIYVGGSYVGEQKNGLTLLLSLV